MDASRQPTFGIGFKPTTSSTRHIAAKGRKQKRITTINQQFNIFIHQRDMPKKLISFLIVRSL